jgi:very-short-patch-repair endonuclease
MPAASKRKAKRQALTDTGSVGEATFALHCKAYKLNPVREYRFHQVRKWRFDFCWPDLMLAVEIEGGIWKMGRHNTPSGMIADIEKYNHATILGFRLLRYTTEQVHLGIAIQEVRAFISRLSGQ